MAIASGLDRLLADECAVLRGKRVGILANPTAVDREWVHIVDRLVAAPGVSVNALFGPEHGIRGDAQDMIAVDRAHDPQTGLPVFSLYGHDVASLEPSLDMLTGLDALVFDIQDVGARYYTFVWTMVLAMRAAARAKLEFVVLDRPNPLGGDRVEGGAITPGYESFVGLVSCPQRHGLTAGEIARWRAREERLDLQLTIVEMGGWERNMLFPETGLPWVQPSPNMPTVDTAMVYPGMCLVEGTELSEGRGTTRPFEVAGAPWLSAGEVASRITSFGLDGVVARPAVFRPMFHKHSPSPCGGIQWHVTNPRTFSPLLAGVAFLKACHDLQPDAFAWRTRAYEFVDQIPAIDLLCGSDQVRRGIDAGATLGDLRATWAAQQDEFERSRAELFLYR